MTPLAIALIVLALILVQGIGLYLIAKRQEKAMQDLAPAKENDTGLLMLQKQLEGLTQTLDSRINESSKSVQESVHRQLTESTRIIREVTEGLTKLDETNRQVVSFADQLQHLQDILQNPKQRGILGEYYLENVLKNVLGPSQFQMQYPFKSGDIVDAVVFVKDRLIPIDSKFSLENYNRALEAREAGERERFEKAFKNDLKVRIDETSKYVLPEEGCMDFAFMFIPSEGVYYDLLSNQVGAMKTSTRDLIEYAFQKKVIIVSPTSFLAYLQTVLQGLKALQIEEQAGEIKKRVGELGKHIGAYQEFHKKMGNALGVAVSHFNASNKELGKIEKDVLRIDGSRIGIEAMALERPAADDD